MTALLVTATVAPLLAAATLRSEQVSQLVLGEGAEVLEREGEMLRVRTLLDGYQGWIAAGYVAELPLAEVEMWLAAAGWSQGALLSDRAGVAIRVPHRARLIVESDNVVQLPDGDRGELLTGTVCSQGEMIATALNEMPADWAWREFAGTPYLWGGVTGAGIDCSALVQNCWLARGVTLPRDAAQQAGHGQVIDPAGRLAGDLLFFRARESDRIGHVAILADEEMLVHSTIDCGGMARESFATGSRAGALLPRLVAVRRVA
ncbi:MAG TPA: C40 family peptidase [Gemmatimonadales bacterium]|jgi:hypothetical protein